MAKKIAEDKFFNDLKKSKAGREYIKLVSNPKNNLSPDEPGEDHHIHMKSLGGECGPMIRLSYFNHCKAHALLAKAALEIDTPWQYEATNTLYIMSGNRLKNLSDFEKITLEDIYEWSELRRIANEKQKEIQNKPEVQEKRRTSMKKVMNIITKKRWDNASNKERETWRNTQIEAQNRPEVKEKKRKSNKKTWENKTEEEMNIWRNLCKEIQNRPEVKEKHIKSEKEAQNRPEVKEKERKAQKEIQNRPEVKEKKSKSMGGRIKIINDNEPKSKKIFPTDLPYWESLGWYRAKKVA